MSMASFSLHVCGASPMFFLLPIVRDISGIDDGVQEQRQIRRCVLVVLRVCSSSARGLARRGETIGLTHAAISVLIPPPQPPSQLQWATL